MSDALLGGSFVLSAAASLAASWLLVSRLERVGARLGLSEALLGMLAAIAADAPEIATAVTAVARGDRRIGTGVVIGSNLFNLAALLGLAALIARRIALHRRVITLQGAVALWICAVTVAAVTGACSPLVALAAAVAVFAPYMAILGARHERMTRLGLRASWRRWLLAAIAEEELELESAISPRRGDARDAAMAGAAVLVVVAASIAMERIASELGSRHAVPTIVVGALVLASVTSLPNAVAAVYLAIRGRATAVLSTALNSNALNVLAGLLLPMAVLGGSAPSAQTSYLAACYAALTVLALALAHRQRGLRRGSGALIIAAYLGTVAVLLAAT